jgi:hypothetical protein
MFVSCGKQRLKKRVYAAFEFEVKAVYAENVEGSYPSTYLVF